MPGPANRRPQILWHCAGCGKGFGARHNASSHIRLTLHRRCQLAGIRRAGVPPVPPPLPPLAPPPLQHGVVMPADINGWRTTFENWAGYHALARHDTSLWTGGGDSPVPLLEIWPGIAWQEFATMWESHIRTWAGLGLDDLWPRPAYEACAAYFFSLPAPSPDQDANVPPLHLPPALLQEMQRRNDLDIRRVVVEFTQARRDAAVWRPQDLNQNAVPFPFSQVPPGFRPHVPGIPVLPFFAEQVRTPLPKPPFAH